MNQIELIEHVTGAVHSIIEPRCSPIVVTCFQVVMH